MSIEAKKEYLIEIKERYSKSDKMGKQKILDEFCTTCRYNRKYAIRLLGKRGERRDIRRKPGRPKTYKQSGVINFLVKLWIALNLGCSRKIKAAIPQWLKYSPINLSEEEKALLGRISFSSIDRLLKSKRRKYKKLGLATTKPGSLLRKQIPVSTSQWNQKVPGFIEADTVAHCGNSVAGQFVYSLQIVDIATGWTEARAVWGKGERGVFLALRDIEESLPFRIKGFDSDNGNEFLNRHLLRYFLEKKPLVQFTRSRPYQKNDNAHIEEKNWTNIRQYLGYQRFDDLSLVSLLNDLYTNEWTMFFNFFVPSMKLQEKIREGAHIRKKHDSPRTPFARLCDSGMLRTGKRSELLKLIEGINPFELQERLKDKILMILKLSDRGKYDEKCA